MDHLDHLDHRTKLNTCRYPLVPRESTSEILSTNGSGIHNGGQTSSTKPALLERTPRKGEYFVTFISLPPRLEEMGLSGLARGTTLKGRFALFTKQPLPQVGKIDVASEEENFQVSLDSYQDALGNRKILRFNPDQLKLMLDYEKSYLHLVSFSGLLSEPDKAHFLDGALLLPVFYDETKSKWGVAWGIIMSACSRDACSVLDGLMEGICDGELDVSRGQEIIYKFAEDLQLPLCRDYLEDAIPFLTLFPMIKDNEELLYSVQNVTSDKKDRMLFQVHKLPCEPWTLADLLQPVESETVVGTPVHGKMLRPYPVPTEWIWLGLLVGKLIPLICDSFRIIEMQSTFPSLSEIAVCDLARAFSSDSPEHSKRLEQLGVNLLNYLLTSDLVIRKQCFFSGTEGYDVGLLARAQGAGECLSLEGRILFLSKHIQTNSHTNAINYPFVPSCKPEDTGEEEATDEKSIEDHELRNAGYGVLAILGAGYTHKGLPWARRFCVELGIIKDETVLNEVEACSGTPWLFRYQWETPKVLTPRSKDSLQQMLQIVYKLFGYKFNVWQRLAHACTHSGFARLKRMTSNYQALDILGYSALTFMITDFCMKTMPSAQQTDLNRLLNPYVLQEIMGRIYGGNDLDYHLLYDKNAYAMSVKLGRKQLGELEPGTLTRYKPPKLWVKCFQALVGAILIDSCFNLDAVRSALVPHLEPYLEQALTLGESELCSSAYKRYIPTHIVPEVYEKSVSEQVVQLHVKIIRFSEPLAGNSKGLEHGFFVLTGKKLPTCPSFETNIPPDWDGKTLKVTIQDCSEDIRSFTAIELGLLEDFQFKFFKDIAVPYQSRIDGRGIYEKRYSILPALKQVIGEHNEWEIDWDLVHHFVNGTTPEAWKEVLPLATSKITPTEGVLDLDSIVTNDTAFENVPLNWVPDDMVHNSEREEPTRIESLMQSIIWRTSKDALFWISHLNPEKFMKKDGEEVYSRAEGVVLNCSGVLNYLPDRPHKRSAALDWVWSTVGIENCHPTPMSVGCFRRAMVLPTVLHRLESFLLADDFRVVYSLPQQLPLFVLATALTCKAAQDLDPDMLSTMGTAVMRYIAGVRIFAEHKQSNAGKMTVLLSSIVHGSLAPVEHRQMIAGHLTSSGFNPHKKKTAWHPPGTKPFHLVRTNEEQHEEQSTKSPKSNSPLIIGDRLVSGDPHLVSEGIVNTHVRSVVGALFLHIGLDPAESFLEKLGVITDRFEFRNVDCKRVNHSRLLAVERSLKYKFNDMRILAEALVHQSMAAGRDYNRLEFLGDLALEILSVQYILERHSDASLGQLFDLKSVMVGNETLARVAMSSKLALHRVLVHSSTTLEAELFEAEQALRESKGAAPGELGIVLPKECGDIFESIVGAVLVDCGFQLEVVWKVFYPLLEEFITKWVNDPEWLWGRLEEEENGTSTVA